jgi:hypothetical protein
VRIVTFASRVAIVAIGVPFAWTGGAGVSVAGAFPVGSLDEACEQATRAARAKQSAARRRPRV